MLPSSRYIRCAGYEIHCTEWGAPEAPVVIAWHGLARTGRDMDALARHLSSRYRVICPDTIGALDWYLYGRRDWHGVRVRAFRAAAQGPHHAPAA